MIQVFFTIDPQYVLSEEPLQKAIEQKLHQEGIRGSTEVSVSIVDRDEMAAVCAQYMDDDLEHDVVSFPFEEGHDFVSPDQVRRLGDIVVSYPMAEEQAGEKGISIQASLSFLIDHALMHLLGHHHDDEIS